MQLIQRMVRRLGPWTLSLPFFYMGLLFFLSSIHGGAHNIPWLGYTFQLDPVVGNFLHFPLYYCLGVLWKLALDMRQVSDGKATLLACALGTLYGALDEVHQHFVPHRCMDPMDALVDLLGVLLACLTWRYLRPIFLSPKALGG